MKSVILCEGLTDCLFIQYYLKTVHHWQDGNSRSNIKFMRWNRILKKNENNVMLGHDGSCSRLIPMLENVLKSNWMGSIEEAYRKIVIVTDRDDDHSETDFLNEMNRLISEQHGKIVDTIVNNEWCKVFESSEYLLSVHRYSPFLSSPVFLYCIINTARLQVFFCTIVQNKVQNVQIHFLKIGL